MEVMETRPLNHHPYTQNYRALLMELHFSPPVYTMLLLHHQVFKKTRIKHLICAQPCGIGRTKTREPRALPPGSHILAEKTYESTSKGRDGTNTPVLTCTQERGRADTPA